MADAADDLNHLSDAMLSALGQGKLVVVGAIVVLFLVHVFRKFLMPKLKLGTGFLPYLSIILGLIVGVCSDLINGVSASQAAQIALLSGPGASMLWNSVFKLVAKKDVN